MDIRVHSYVSMGTYDGPGIRLVVFLQGCPFRCLYCANPDTIPAEGGRMTSPGDIVRMAVAEKPFFGRRGGVTFSGGEPTLQAKALIPIVEELKACGINVCLDTNGGIWNRHVEQLLKLTDLVLLDVKEFDRQRHLDITGKENTQTLATAKWLEDNGKPFWLRYVLVPGISDYEQDIRALGEHFRDYRMIERVEILPYHTLGVNKYEALGQEYRLKDVPLNTREQLERAEALFKEYFECTVLN
ncbi:MAG: pyruvate formate lyase-activating protein [Bacteroidetes bacterium]|uniref:Pyruvate formate-lyase-activating enzyme n=1 Tax=Candidatus Cryptobacteroides faecavium TaxID=2840762 RepID=A0A9D9NF88_9BACT|nr:pyruvate formate lyase-activating protein [Candidatus Cryptobacteroides faecavium]